MDKDKRSAETVATTEKKTKLMSEEWKALKGFEGCYEISNYGRIKSVCRIISHKRLGNKRVNERILRAFKTGTSAQGYLGVSLKNNNGKIVNVKIHRAVAETFIPNPENKREVNHIDGNTHNNRVDNLEWVSSVENMKHAKSIGKLDFLYRGKAVRNRDTGEVFQSCAEASRKYGISADGIRRCAAGKLKTSAGYVWELLEV